MKPSILVPLDGSNVAEAALPFARWLAPSLNAGLLLLTVLPPHEHETGQDHAAAGAWAPTYLEAIATPLRSTGLEVSTEVQYGKAADQISASAAAADARLIVLTTFGRDDDPHHLGPVAERLSRTLPKPALFIPPQSSAPLPPSGPLCVALDGSKTAEGILEPAVELAQATGRPLTLVRVAPWAAELFATFTGIVPPNGDEEIELGSNTYLAAIADRLSARVATEYQTLRGHPAEMLIEYAKGVSGMLVLGSHGHTGIRFWTLGSTTDKVLRASAAPVLVIPAAAAGRTGLGLAADAGTTPKVGESPPASRG